MKLEITIQIQRDANRFEELAHIQNIPEIKDFMEKEVGILPNTCKMITPLILTNMSAMLEEIALEKSTGDYIDNPDGIDYINNVNSEYQQYLDSLYELTKAIDRVNTSRKFGQAIFYKSNLK